MWSKDVRCSFLSTLFSFHTICGRLVGEEGYGSSVVCPGCDLASRKETCSTMRAGIKRNQESLHHRMLNSSSKKFKPAHIGNTVMIPISEPDKVNSLGPRNIIGCITGKDDSTYTVGTLKAQSQLFILGISLSYVPVIYSLLKVSRMRP